VPSNPPGARPYSASSCAGFEGEPEPLRVERGRPRARQLVLTCEPYPSEEVGADATGAHDRDAHDVVAFAEDVVRLPEGDSESDGEDAESCDLARSRAERGDERADDERTHQHGVVEREVGDVHDHDDQQPTSQPPPRLRDCARGLGLHRSYVNRASELAFRFTPERSD
jgi:hypothetical protein